MLDFISKESVFYIVAPAGLATGGPELLHQLAVKLKAKGKGVKIFYTQIDSSKPVKDPVHPNYKQYDIEYVDEIPDAENNVVIVPETRTYILNNFVKAKKIVWWLSVDNYFLYLPGIKGRINRILLHKFGSQNYLFFNRKLKLVDYHLVQSEYAMNMLTKYGVYNIDFLGDYLHESFLQERVDNNKKENIVAYNPLKGIKFTKKLIKHSEGINFVPIQNMTREQVVELLKKSKVYIDFGFHPGKDRIPREAAFLNCCVISNIRGSAGFKKDVPINEKFKFQDVNENFSKVISMINSCFNSFDEKILEFESYRDEIIQQESEFEKQIDKLFI